MKSGLRAVLIGLLALSGCRTPRQVAASSYQQATAPVDVVRPSTTGTTPAVTTTTTTRPPVDAVSTAATASPPPPTHRADAPVSAASAPGQTTVESPQPAS